MIRINWHDYGAEYSKSIRNATLHNQKDANKVISKFLNRFQYKKTYFSQGHQTPRARISIGRDGIKIKLW